MGRRGGAADRAAGLGLVGPAPFADGMSRYLLMVGVRGAEKLRGVNLANVFMLQTVKGCSLVHAFRPHLHILGPNPLSSLSSLRILIRGDLPHTLLQQDNTPLIPNLLRPFFHRPLNPNRTSSPTRRGIIAQPSLQFRDDGCELTMRYYCQKAFFGAFQEDFVGSAEELDERFEVERHEGFEVLGEARGKSL